MIYRNTIEAVFSMAIIRTLNLTKKYKDILAVDRVSLAIEEGECFGLLGPNGSGKTTMVRMITAVSPPTQGDIWIFDNDLKTHSRQLKAVLGVVPQLDNLDPDLTVLQNLITFARYFNISKDEAYKRSMEVLTLFELNNRTNSRIKELSGGMKRRLLIARGLINRPKIIILDEPTIGLDPQAKHLVWHKLTELKYQGITQLMCTQNMEEATILCNRVAVMHLGKILDLDTPQKLISKYVGNKVWEIKVNPDERVAAINSLKRGGVNFEEIGNKIHVFSMEANKSIQDLVNSPDRLVQRPSTLEDVFFRLTGRSLLE
jgi:lipooligosaccharide transport system ATP-binding protein